MNKKNMRWIRVTSKTGQILNINPEQIIMLKHTPAIPTAWPDYYTLVVQGAEYDLDEASYNQLLSMYDE